jgi:hypothetical protein
MKLPSTLEPVFENYYKINIKIRVSVLNFVILTGYVPELTFKILSFAFFQWDDLFT